MTRPVAALEARSSLADRRAESGRVVTNRDRPQRMPRQRRAVGTRGGALPASMIFNALDQMQAIIGTVDGRIVHWSRGAELLYGWTAGEAIGRPPRDLLKQKRVGGGEEIAARPERGGIGNREFSRAHKDGRDLTIAAHCVSRCDDNGRAVVIELDDLVERAERPAHPDPAPPEPSRSDQTGAADCPTRRIVHDFNNLLGIITLNLELARQRAAAGGEVREMIEEALGAAWQSCELAGRLADFARRQPARAEPVGDR